MSEELHEPGEEQMFMCPYINAIPCRFGECYRCKTCENNPEFYIKDENLLKEFAEHAGLPYCLTCGVWDSFANHPKKEGHLVCVGLEEYKTMLPDAIMDRMLRREGQIK